jgi:cysteine dioxygenase
MEQKEVERYSYFDASRKYTRNLIATDNETYTLLLLCWNPGMKSPIHDHPCDGCWMRVLNGKIQEKRYRMDNATSTLVCTQDATVSEGGLVFIADSQGYHSVGNPSDTTPAITLHLYSPPFQKCKVWLGERRKPTTSSFCYDTEYGRKV